MKTIIIFILFFFALIPNFLYSQSNEVIGVDNLDFITSILEAEKLAKKDVENNNHILILISGINPVFFEKDSKIEGKYNFKYHDYGCVAPKSEYIIAYNRIILQSLCKKYGRKFLHQIRKDIIGYKIFKKENFC